MSEKPAPHHRIPNRPYASATILLLTGLFFLIGGLRLLQLGGSPYYAVSSLPLLASAVMLFRRRPSGYLLYAAFLGGTAIWAWAEAGPAFWPLFARLGAPLFLAAGMALPWLWRRFGPPRLAAGFILCLLLGAMTWTVTMRLPNPDDGRSAFLTLTTAGEAAYRRARALFLPAHARIAELLALPVADVQAALTALDRAVRQTRAERDAALEGGVER